MTVLVVDNLLVKGLPDALGQAAVYLGFGQVMIQYPPAVIHGEIFENVHLAGVAVYLDHGQVSARREG